MEKIIEDTNPFVLIKVKNSKGQVIFYSSDPLEIGKHNLNGLGIDCFIDIDNKSYTIKSLSITVLGSPMGFEYGIDSDRNSFVGREIPFLCSIKITVAE